MGNKQPKSQKSQNKILEHPRFEKAKLAVNKKLLVEYKYVQDFTQFNKKIHAINPHDQKVPLLLPKIEMTHTQNLCSIDKSINLIFNYYRTTLQEEITLRKEKRINFDETELWFLLYHLVRGSSLFERKKQKSGDVRPRNVLIDDKGNIGMVNTLSFPDQLTNYYKSFYRKQATYLAPQELAELEMRVKYCKSDPSIAEAFSIGLTMLDASLLVDCQQLYDFQEFSFKNYQFQDNLVAFKSLALSPFYIKTVTNLLEVHSFNRPSPGQVLAIIQPYQRQIVDLNEFIPDRQRSQQSLQNYQNTRL